MDEQNIHSCTAFLGIRRVASGSLAEIAKRVKESVDREELSSVLIFDDMTSELVEVDFRGTVDDVLKRMEKLKAGIEPAASSDPSLSSRRRPGRPNLGVVSREVTLLPRHWDWLNIQPGGASVALRKLVEEARRIYKGRDMVRHSQESSYRFMSAMAGNLPGFEEATRALFAGDRDRFNDLVASWPSDIRDHVHKLSGAVFRNPLNENIKNG